MMIRALYLVSRALMLISLLILPCLSEVSTFGSQESTTSYDGLYQLVEMHDAQGNVVPLPVRPCPSILRRACSNYTMAIRQGVSDTVEGTNYRFTLLIGNRISGSLTVQDDNFRASISQIIGTRMGFDEDVTNFEALVRPLLAATDGVSLRGRSLALSGKQGNLLFLKHS